MNRRCSIQLMQNLNLNHNNLFSTFCTFLYFYLYFIFSTNIVYAVNFLFNFFKAWAICKLYFFLSYDKYIEHQIVSKWNSAARWPSGGGQWVHTLTQVDPPWAEILAALLAKSLAEFHGRRRRGGVYFARVDLDDLTPPAAFRWILCRKSMRSRDAKLFVWKIVGP